MSQPYNQNFQNTQTFRFPNPHYNQMRFNYMHSAIPNWQNIHQPQIGDNQMYQGNYNFQTTAPMQNDDITHGSNAQMPYTGQHQNFRNMQNTQNNSPQNNDRNNEQQPAITFPSENRQQRGRYHNNRRRGHNHLNL